LSILLRLLLSRAPLVALGDVRFHSNASLTPRLCVFSIGALRQSDTGLLCNQTTRGVRTLWHIQQDSARLRPNSIAVLPHKARLDARPIGLADGDRSSTVPPSCWSSTRSCGSGTTTTCSPRGELEQS